MAKITTSRRGIFRTTALVLVGVSLLFITIILGIAYQRSLLSSQLIAALKARDTHKATLLVKQGADPNTLLDPPSLLSLPALMQFLFRRPEADHYRPTAFMIACLAPWNDANDNAHSIDLEDPELVETMIKHGAHIDMKDELGRTVLMWTALRGCFRVSNVLIKNGAAIDLQQNDGETALMMTMIQPDSNDISVQLLQKGANFRIKDKQGQSAFDYASVAEDMTSLNTLFEYCHDGTKETQVAMGDALITAVINARTRVVEPLLQHGAPVDYKDATDRTALHHIILQFKVIDKNDQKDEQKEEQRELIKIIRILLKYHADPNAKDKSGATPLDFASKLSRCPPEVVALLRQVARSTPHSTH